MSKAPRLSRPLTITECKQYVDGLIGWTYSIERTHYLDPDQPVGEYDVESVVLIGPGTNRITIKANRKVTRKHWRQAVAALRARGG